MPNSTAANRWLFLLFFIFTQNLFSLQNEEQYTYESFVFSDSTDYSLTEIQNKTFLPKRGVDFSFGMSNNWNWIKIKIENKSNEDKKLFVVIQTSMINHLDIYYVNEAGVVLDSMQTGNHFAFHTRKIDSKNFIFPFTQKANQNSVVFIKCKNELGTLNVPLRILEEDQYHKYDKNDLWISVLLYFIWFLASIVTFVIFLFLRQKIYFYYFAYVFCMLLFWASYDGFLFQMLWPNFPMINDHLRDMYLLSSMSFSSFVFKVLTFKKDTFPIVKRILKYVHLYLLLVFIGQFTKIYALLGIANFMVSLGDIGIVFLGLIILYMIIYRLYYKEKIAWIFLLSTLPLWIYGVLQMLNMRGIKIFENGLLNHYGFGLIIVFEVVVMFSMLLYKQFFLERENEIMRIKMKTQKEVQKTLFEKEKNEIKSELHDQIGNNLFLMKLKLFELMKVDEQKSKDLENLASLTSMSIDELRNILWVLHSENITALDFYQKLRELVANFKNSQKDISINLVNEIENEDTILSYKKVLQILRILQESVTNAIKYSRSEQIIIELGLDNDYLSLKVIDFGVGLPENYLQNGYGFSNMKKRIAEVGGSLQIISDRNKGTIISAQISI